MKDDLGIEMKKDVLVDFALLRDLMVNMAMNGATVYEMQQVIDFSQVLMESKKAWLRFGMQELVDKYYKHEHTE